jgi:hypothetical protein
MNTLVYENITVQITSRCLDLERNCGLIIFVLYKTALILQSRKKRVGPLFPKLKYVPRGTKIVQFYKLQFEKNCDAK